jgi:hypothetical protein
MKYLLVGVYQVALRSKIGPAPGDIKAHTGLNKIAANIFNLKK